MNWKLLLRVAEVRIELLDDVKDLSHAHRIRPADVAPGRLRGLVHPDESLGDVADVHDILHLVVDGVAVAWAVHVSCICDIYIYARARTRDACILPLR